MNRELVNEGWMKAAFSNQAEQLSAAQRSALHSHSTSSTIGLVVPHPFSSLPFCVCLLPFPQNVCLFF
jgi:hypothetical protein